MNILVSHSNALISAGLVATMQGIVGCDVKSSKGKEHLDWDFALQDIDVLVADFAALVRSVIEPEGPNSSRPFAKPQIVLLTALGDAAATVEPMPPGISARLPMDCGQEDLLNTVCNLIGSTRPASQASRTTGDAQSSEPAATLRPRGGLAPSALRRVREHIEDNLGERIDIDELAAVTGLSACHFSRAFKQSMGMPPHRFVMSRRVIAATRLIELTKKPMSEIAIQVGFSDQSHFTRVFTAQIGQSPQRYRHERR
jgi:AraC-like DNA-binding protein